MLLRTSSKRAARWVGDCRPSYPGVHVGLGAAAAAAAAAAAGVTLSLLCGGTGGGDAAGAILSDTCDPSFEANTLREESLANLSARVAGSLLPDPCESRAFVPRGVPPETLGLPRGLLSRWLTFGGGVRRRGGE